MMIIGCDFHPSWQQIAWLDSETGETGERKLVHAAGDAKAFYQQLAVPARHQYPHKERNEGQRDTQEAQFSTSSASSSSSHASRSSGFRFPR